MAQPIETVRTPLPQSQEMLQAVTHVNFAGAKHINDKVKALANGPALENLQILDFSQGKDLQNRYVIKCIKKFQTITKLNLTGCRKIEDKTLIEIGKYLPNLTHLKLSVCPLITGNGLDAVVNGCKKLEYLNLALDFNTCEKRYKEKIESIYNVASIMGVKEEHLTQYTPLVIEIGMPKVQERIEEKTETKITFQDLQNLVKKCDALKQLYVPCILETKQDLLQIMLEEDKHLGKTALKFIEELPETRDLQVLTYEKDPSLVWSSPEEWYVPSESKNKQKIDFC